MRMRLLVILAMVFTLALAGTALAQDQNPTQDGYGGVLGEEVSNSDDGGGGSPPPPGGDDDEEGVVVTQASDGGSLPFTGLELGLVALAGFGLVTLGFMMRRTTRHSAT
jgi:S1-C subfamily serine protease